ncbi:hypothetical protein A2U01_0104364, partial [Trifolium medium]|nr:hypothetical protein [Trifolium medium]
AGSTLRHGAEQVWESFSQLRAAQAKMARRANKWEG